jgi:hypothetical protein
MSENNTTHLLSSLGVLASFSIAKRVSKEEILRTTKKIKKIYKEADPEKLKQLLTDALISSTKKYVTNEIPPGLVFPEKNPIKEKLDKYYTELSVVSQVLSNKFIEQKLTKRQVCFIVNAVINILGINENDFADFHRKFQKYKDDDFTEDEE